MLKRYKSMRCRVGMSADPEDRIDYWKRREGHTGDEILARHLTYKEAQECEKLEARNRGCFRQGGGKHLPGRVWSVYHVWGGIVRRSL